MPVPTFVGAGSGVLITTGTATVSKANCTAGNLIVTHILERGTPADATRANRVNTTSLAGSANSDTALVTSAGVGTPSSRHHLYCGRVTANGTCSVDWTVGASGFDLICRMYEFSAPSEGTVITALFENNLGTHRTLEINTGTSVPDADVQTLELQRLALQFVALEINQSIGEFTGQSGGIWIEVAEYQEAGGATGTLQLQIAAMGFPGVIGGGSAPISSTGYGVIGTAVKPFSIDREQSRAVVGGRGAC